MTLKLIDLIVDGGCYWPNAETSPGHSICLENGTPFRVAVEGPESGGYISGVCENGYFVVTQGRLSGSQYESANAVVNSLREPNSNAFLYIGFKIGGRFITADDLRHRQDSGFDPVHEEALNIAIKKLRENPDIKGKDIPTLRKIAAKNIQRNPEPFIRAAKTRIEGWSIISDIVL